MRWDTKLKDCFVQFIKTKRRATNDGRTVKSYLNVEPLHATRGPLKTRAVFDMFMQCQGGHHHLGRAFRNLLNFYRRVLGYPKNSVEDLKEATNTKVEHVDNWVPPEDLVIESLRELKNRHAKSFAYLNALLDCPIRLEHLAEVLSEFDPNELEKTPEGFYKYREHRVRY